MAVKKANATQATDLTHQAVKLALALLASDAVQQQLRRAPESAMKWAADRSKQRSAHGPSVASKLNPSHYFGQRSLERRAANLSEAIGRAFGDRSVSIRPELWDAIDELATAIDVASRMPTVKRMRMHRRIDDDLDELELGLIDALLPKR